MKKLLRRVAAFLAELRRRKVYQVAVVYMIVAIGALELADVLVPATVLPTWSEEFFIVLAIVGFPLVVVLAWVFDVTPEGVRRESRAPHDAPAGPGSPPAVAKGAPTRPDGEAAPAGRETDRVAAESSEVHAGPDPELDRNAVAVLPFTNLSGAPDAEPFAAGLHDDLLTELSRASALTVISRTSVRRYGGSEKSIPEIGRALGAGTVVEAGVQKAGDRVRLNVQLIDAVSDVHLWAERYDRELSAETIFDLQSELATRIMEALHTKLTGSEERQPRERPTADLEAYRQYSIGRAVGIERSEEALRRAIEHLERAVARDPQYAPAWAELGMVCIGMVDYRHSDSEELAERGEVAARRALELDPGLAEAHSAIGNLHAARRRSRKAIEAQERAIALRPGYAGAHQWRCWASLLIGDVSNALEAGRRAVRLDPLDPEARGNLALSRLGTDDDRKALDEAREALERHPGFDYARWVAALALVHLSRDDEADETFRALSERWASAWPETATGLARARAGDPAGARAALERQREAGAVFHAGLLHAVLGEPEDAFEAIRSVLPLEWDEALYLRYFRGTPIETLRDDPRWTGLERALDRGWGA